VITPEQKRREEAKRDAAGDSATRWRQLQQMIAWAEAQAPVRRNTPAACKAREARLLRQR
jgi:hypothetical protein